MKINVLKTGNGQSERMHKRFAAVLPNTGSFTCRWYEIYFIYTTGLKNRWLV